MTKIITRYFASADRAQMALEELVAIERLSPRIIGLYDSPRALEEMLSYVPVETSTAEEYRKRIADGGAVLMVRAGYRPLGAAQTTRNVTRKLGAADLGGLIQEIRVDDEKDRLGNSVLLDHPLLLTRRRVPGSSNYHMADWPISLISRRKPSTESLIEPHAYMANKPIGHLVPHNVRFGRFPFDLLVPGHKFMAKFPFGHLVPHNVRYGRFPFDLLVPHNVRYGRFPFDLLVPGHKFMAKFPFGHLVPGGMRMANWPFPLLINGKPGTNSIIPGSPWMANFPFGHLVPHNVRYGRFPFDLLVPGQKYMAKFPFAHIVPGHKYMAKFPFAHIVPGHKHMANFILPLLSKRSENGTGGRWSFSRMLGLPTLKER